MLDLDFSSFPVLTTDRLVLRQLTAHDADRIHELRSDKKVNELIGRAESASIEEAREFIKKIEGLVKNNQCIYWGITLKNDSTLIGTICFWNFDINNDTVEVGYELLPVFQGKGIMVETIKRVIEYGFDEMKVETIVAFPSADNIRSVALLKKMNFSIDNTVHSNTHENVNGIVTYTLKKIG